MCGSAKGFPCRRFLVVNVLTAPPTLANGGIKAETLLQEAFVPGSEQNKWSNPIPLSLSRIPNPNLLGWWGWAEREERLGASQGPHVKCPQSPLLRGVRRKQSSRKRGGMRQETIAFPTVSQHLPLNASPPSSR